MVEYGKAINLQEYRHLLEENEAKAINMLKDRLSESISELMFNIKDTKNYQAIKDASSFLVPHSASLEEDFEARKKFIKSCSEDAEISSEWSKIQEVKSKLDSSKGTAEDWRESQSGKIFPLVIPFYF
ncbi:MAG: hypothetical protein HC852_10550 [Acaryochloridaceae cyanobacterium RU_4_10]|nr:hypothetical protein [Acaryochloridaceae cyanobacterium RU_4_10]